MRLDLSERASSRWTRTAVWLLLLGPPAALYLAHVGQGFVSEDFPLIRLHLERPPWSDLVGTFTEPWIGMREVFGYLVQLKNLYWLRMFGRSRPAVEYRRVTEAEVARAAERVG